MGNKRPLYSYFFKQTHLLKQSLLFINSRVPYLPMQRILGSTNFQHKLLLYGYFTPFIYHESDNFLELSVDATLKTLTSSTFRSFDQNTALSFSWLISHYTGFVETYLLKTLSNVTPQLDQVVLTKPLFNQSPGVNFGLPK
jgi:hypothetical protein